MNKNNQGVPLSKQQKRFNEYHKRNQTYHKDSNNKKDFKKSKYQKITNEDLLEKYNFDFSRNAEWFKNTIEKISQIKDDLDKKFYNEEKKAQKLDFMRKLKDKLKDYKDAIKYAEKYRKVRFFERRKLERMLTKVNKEIKNTDTTDEQKLKELEVKKDKVINDINYVKVNKWLNLNSFIQKHTNTIL
jgi:myosin heavy subunit